MTAEEAVALPPRLVLLLGVVGVSVNESGEGVAVAPGTALGERVLPLDRGEHDLGRDLASVAQADGSGVADVAPARAAVVRVHRLERALPARLDPQAEAALVRVPHSKRAGGLAADMPHELLGQPPASGRSGRRPVSLRSRHFGLGFRINAG
jgi:hypothetical protein